ncbi:MAG TPA: MCE family protein [Mycobacterium sp.]|uniref:MCE family protein n=1 Tax=Mycobacterium sp. TaxID=1785 RepID=UPI002D4C3057|nr:MCE family protein [Mycobacterium sp.]HXY65968.1 MCE family protein [Mycobacterium sp.]
MKTRPGEHRIATAWWTLILIAVIAATIFATVTAYEGTFQPYVPVTLTSDRSGLVLETGAKVMLRGVQVGRVSQIAPGKNQASLKLEIDPDQIRYIPANVQAKIDVTTVFGAKFVDLISPSAPSPKRLAAGAVLHSSNVTTEVNTVFENVVDLLKMVDAEKLNAVLTAVADAVRGRGQRIGEATTDLNQVLSALNSRSDTIRQDLRSFTGFNNTYAAAAQDIMAILNAASTTSDTIVKHKTALDDVLLNVVGFANAGTNLLGTSRDNLVASVNTLEPTTSLLLKYNPEYTCTLQGSKWFLDNGAYQVWGGDGRSIQLDVGLLLGNDPYIYPDNLPIVAAKGGPGGQPGCGSLPDPTKNFPVRQLVTNTGWGTGVDIRTNPGIGHPCYGSFFGATHPVSEPPQPTLDAPASATSRRFRQCIPGPAPGLIPYPGAPPYGAPLYGPGGVPLWPGVPPAQPSPAPAGNTPPP